jgi:NAD(P)-dependent dehydrogenase (short-subunit alcohol dehydrogenase family)
MLTRKTAIAKLREAGTLASSGVPVNTITPAEVDSPLAHALASTLAREKTRSSPRLLAPSFAHVVLP